MYVEMVQSAWEQKAGTCITTAVSRFYNFFYFPTPIQVMEDGELKWTKPHACVLSEPKRIRNFYFPEDTIICWTHNPVQVEDMIKKYEIPLNCVFYLSNSSVLPEIFQKMRKEFRLKDPYREELLDIYTEELFIKLSRYTKHKDEMVSVNSIAQRKMYDLRWEVLSHPEKNWTVEEMANAVMLSPSRFHAVYKLMFGSSPMKEIINAKIDQAKAILLAEERINLTAVAEQLGYSNQYHFIRQFKSITGVTPGTYQKNNR